MRDYKKWHNLKSEIEKITTLFPFREREVWWAHLGANVGHEEDGKNDNFERPVLVTRKFNKHIFVGLPLTSRRKKGVYYANFRIRKRKGSVVLSQIRILSSKRLIRKIGKIGNKQFGNIMEKKREIYDSKNKKETDSSRSPQVPNGNL